MVYYWTCLQPPLSPKTGSLLFDWNFFHVSFEKKLLVYKRVICLYFEFSCKNPPFSNPVQEKPDLRITHNLNNNEYALLKLVPFALMHSVEDRMVYMVLTSIQFEICLRISNQINQMVSTLNLPPIHCKTLGWFSNRMGTLFDDRKERGKD